MKFAVILIVVLVGASAYKIDRNHEKRYSSGHLANELQIAVNHRLIRSVNGRPKQDSSHSVRGTSGHAAVKTKPKPPLQVAPLQQVTGIPEEVPNTDDIKLPDIPQNAPDTENNEAALEDDQTVLELADGYTENGQAVTIIETTIILEALTQSPQDVLASQDQENVNTEDQQIDIPDLETSGPKSHVVENDDPQPLVPVRAAKIEVDSKPQIEEKPVQLAKNPVEKTHPVNEADHKLHPVQNPSQPVNQQPSNSQLPQKPITKSQPAEKIPSTPQAPHVKNPVKEPESPEGRPSSKPKTVNNKPQPGAAQATKPQQVKPALKPQPPHKTSSHSQPAKTSLPSPKSEEKPESEDHPAENPDSNPNTVPNSQAPEQPASSPLTEAKPVLKPQPPKKPAPVPKPEVKPQPPKKPTLEPKLEVKLQPPKKPATNPKQVEKPQSPKNPVPNSEPEVKPQPPKKPVPAHKPEEKPQLPKKPTPNTEPQEKPQLPKNPVPKPEEKPAPKPQLPVVPVLEVPLEEKATLQPQGEKKPIPIPKPLPGEKLAPKYHSEDKISHKPRHINSSKVKHDSDSKGELSNNSRVALISLGVIAATLVLIVMGVWYRKISVYNYRYGGHTLLTQNDDEEFGVFNRLTYNEDVKTYDSWRDIDY